jgi:hypothetical protein
MLNFLIADKDICQSTTCFPCSDTVVSLCLNTCGLLRNQKYNRLPFPVGGHNIFGGDKNELSMAYFWSLAKNAVADEGRGTAWGLRPLSRVKVSKLGAAQFAAQALRRLYTAIAHRCSFHGSGARSQV